MLEAAGRRTDDDGGLHRPRRHHAPSCVEQTKEIFTLRPFPGIVLAAGVDSVQALGDGRLACSPGCTAPCRHEKGCCRKLKKMPAVQHHQSSPLTFVRSDSSILSD